MMAQVLLISPNNAPAYLKGTDIEAAPNFGSRLDTDCIHGMAKAGDRVKILLDLDPVLSAEQMGALQKAAQLKI